MNIQSMSNLKQRFIFGNLSTITMFLAIYLSTNQYLKIFFIALIAGIIGMALWEFYAMARNKKYQPLAYYAIASSMVYLFATYISTQYHVFPMLPQLTLLLTMVGAFAYFFDKGQNSMSNIAITLFGLVYLTLPLTGMIQINYFFPAESLQDGRLWLTYLLLVTKMTDIGAYFIGKNFGKHKITPYISPSKTIEGSIGGLLAAILMSLAFYFVTQYFSLPFTLSLNEALCLGTIIGVVGQFGDLAESLLKRDCEVKDSNQLPGLGGVLDTADSIIFTVPLVYFFMNAKFAQEILR
ncbi:MAG: CDP-archaeol synthase [Parachlamydiaceae bacterium]|nr:CDP-archaeol synthase [Parachlamydiaceae bacterium]